MTWYVRYTVSGQEVRERIGREADGVTRTHAKDALKARLGDLVRGRFRLPEARRPLPFRVLIKRYREKAEAKRSYARERYTLEALEREFGALALTELSSFRIEKWKNARRKAGLESGGGGNRTPVRRCVHERVYVCSLCTVVAAIAPAGRISHGQPASISAPAPPAHARAQPEVRRLSRPYGRRPVRRAA